MAKGPALTRALAGWAILAATIGVPALGSAQSPGPMSRGHAELSGFPADCNRCHSAGFGVPDEKCLSCHTHQPLRARIRAGLGFHASEPVEAEQCRDCHVEHLESRPGSGRGRSSLIDWRPFGGKRNFDHRLTGWPLEGKHRYTDCEKCHSKKTPKGMATFLGQRTACTSCHFGQGAEAGPGGPNPHRFTDVALTDCTVCHDQAKWSVERLGATRFDHDRTEFPLRGQHVERRCTGCHERLETFEVEVDFDDCGGCHDDSHRSVISRGRWDGRRIREAGPRRCDDCHTPKVEFRRTRFRHEAEVGFPLDGRHAENRCQDCHEVDSGTEAPDANCAACHEDVHRARFEPEPCESCHVADGFGKMVYDHAARADMALTGQHGKIPCGDCHRFGIGPRFERFESGECADCHRHEGAHCGQFGRENCERCHVRGGDRTSRFDHALTRFPLERAHASVDCARCHRPARLGEGPDCRDAVAYAGLDPSCGGCHTDAHGGSLGSDCRRCHTGGAPFATVVFDHDRDSRFPLTGFHQLTACAECHPQRTYALGETRCVSCHDDDDVHQARLGDDCARCHEPSGGAPKFEHALHARWPLEGTHRRIECERCHFLLEDGTSPRDRALEFLGRMPSAERAMTSTGADELPVDAVRLFPALAPAGAPLDLEFRAMGRACESCHPDPHRVRETRTDCAACHGAERWEEPPRNGYHQGAGFALVGAHTSVACDRCHEGVGSLRGRGQDCGDCHRMDDVHAGSFGSDCGRCHEQSFWLPSSFTHVEVGFVLEGVHRMLDCRSCHQAGNYFIGRDCTSCHLADYRRSTWHQRDAVLNRNLGDGSRFYVNGGYTDGQGLDSYDCGACHNQFTFFGAYGAPR